MYQSPKAIRGTQTGSTQQTTTKCKVWRNRELAARRQKLSRNVWNHWNFRSNTFYKVHTQPGPQLFPFFWTEKDSVFQEEQYVQKNCHQTGIICGLRTNATSLRWKLSAPALWSSQWEASGLVQNVISWGLWTWCSFPAHFDATKTCHWKSSREFSTGPSRFFLLNKLHHSRSIWNAKQVFVHTTKFCFTADPQKRICFEFPRLQFWGLHDGDTLADFVPIPPTAQQNDNSFERKASENWGKGQDCVHTVDFPETIGLKTCGTQKNCTKAAQGFCNSAAFSAVQSDQ